MSGATGCLLAKVPSGTKARQFLAGFVLNDADAAELMAIAVDDADRYTYNALASFLGAVDCLRQDRAAWATTKFYYTAFYVGRAFLSRQGHLIFHIPKEGKGHTPYELKAQVGSAPKMVTTTSSTHKLVNTRFKALGYPPFMTGLVVDGQDPLEWLMEQREFCQYRALRFPDPEMPATFARLEFDRLQRLLAAYLGGGSGVYLADPEHALLAIPYRLTHWALGQAKLMRVADEKELAYLQKRCLIGRQNISSLLPVG